MTSPIGNAACDQAPLRVAQLVETLAVGGAERLAVQIAGGRAAAGDRSLILVLGEPGPLAAQVDPRVEIRYLDVARESVTRPWQFLASLRRGLRQLRAEVRRAELQVVQSHLPNANFWGLLLALRDPVAVIPTVHNNNEFYYGQIAPPRIRSRLRRLAYRLMLHRCAAMVAVSDQVARSLLRETGATEREAGRLRVIPNGVPEPAPLADEERETLRRELGCRRGEMLVLAAGRHSEQKNFEALIAAAGRLRDQGVTYRFVIAGDGELRGRHHAMVSMQDLGDRVFLPGNLSDLPSVMQAADVFVLPSLWEGLPLVLLEAMAAGTPVVGSAIDGISEVVTDDETGLLTPPDDPDALAAALLRLRNRRLRTRLREGGLQLVRDHYSFARVDDQISALYRGIVATSSAAAPAAVTPAAR